MSIELLYIVLGVVVGAVLGLTGSGGGIIAIPILVYGLGLTLKEATPISLMTVCLSAYVGSYIGLKNGLLRYRAALWMFIAGILTTPIGFYFSKHLPEQYLSLMFLVLLGADIYSMINKIRLEDFNQHIEKPTFCSITDAGRFVWNKTTYFLLGIIGLIIGFFSGLLGVAGGFVVIPSLSRISRLSMEAITATSLGVVALFGTSNIIFSAQQGHVNWHIGFWFALGGGIGMLLGRTLSKKISSQHLQMFYVAISFITAIGLLISIIQHF